jgi:hypothetical protein
VVTGWIGVALSAAAVATALISDPSRLGVQYALGAGVFGVLMWCFMLRPRVAIGPQVLELRNAFSSWHVPLVEVRRVAVRAITRVYTEERRFDGVAVGRPIRAMIRPRVGPGEIADVDPSRDQLDSDLVADFVTDQILIAADRARAEGHEPVAAVRAWALPELVALGLLLAGLVLSFVV